MSSVCSSGRRCLGAVGTLAVCGLALVLLGCPPPPAHRGPVVLITLDALRADAVGATGGPPGLTPALDGLAARADLTCRAVSTSSWTVPAMGSVFTGLQPWRHGAWHGDRPVLAEELLTLPEALAQEGYATVGFRSNHWLNRKYGYHQGFDDFYDLGQGKRAEATLRRLDGGPTFVWIHVLPPHAPYVRHDHLLFRLPAAPAELPEVVRPQDLEPFYDPAVPLPAEQEAVFRALYLSNVAGADETVGRLLAALEASGRWDETLLVVTADHGEEFGEGDQVLHGGNLGRVLLEVPLLVKLPAGSPRGLAAAPGERISTRRLFATLVEAVGGTPAPETGPSLFAAGGAPVLSELYQGNGENRISWLEGDRQLVWRSRFAPPEPDYFRARRAFLGAPVEPPLLEPPKTLFARLNHRFSQVPPLSGRDGTPSLELWQWGDDGGSRRLQDAEATGRLARRLRHGWQQANGRERVPATVTSAARPETSAEDEEELRNLGYVGGGP